MFSFARTFFRQPMTTTTFPAPHEVVCELAPRQSLEERAMRGDAAAWDALVRLHNHRVVVSLLARGVRVDRARDLAQDAWLRLIEQQREGRLPRLLLPGLAVAQATFLFLDSQRRSLRAERRTAGGSVESFADIADPQVDAEGRLLAAEQLAHAAAVLETCTPSSQRVFRLVYGGEGLSHAQVAARVGLSVQRVRQIVCELRDLLRAAVGVRGGQDHE